MSVEVTRMQDLVYKFSNILRGDTRTPTTGGSDPLPHLPPARPVAGRGAQAPGRARGASTPVLGPKP